MKKRSLKTGSVEGDAAVREKFKSRYEDSYSTSRSTFRCCERICPEEEI